MFYKLNGTETVNIKKQALGIYVTTQWNEGSVARNYNFWPCFTYEPLYKEKINQGTITHPKDWGE
ncbi:MAG: hypothetical protein NC095_07475 [Muribaculum sp.]|nr:hypothetical protein [Muribaculum sp.]